MIKEFTSTIVNIEHLFMKRIAQMQQQSKNYGGLSHEDIRVLFQETNARLRHNLDGFWIRANFILVVQTGFLSAFAVIVNLFSSHGSFNPINFVLGLVGLLQSVLGLAFTWSNLKHVEHWREIVQKIARMFDTSGIYAEAESYAQANITPSKLVPFVNVLFILGWLALLGVLLWSAFGH